MFKLLTAVLLLLAFVSQTFTRAVIVVDFYANQQYIAQNLCENKSKPQIGCGGKCQLKKRLNTEDNKDKQNPERRSDNKEEVLSSQSFFASLSYFQPSLKSTFYNGKAQATTDMAAEFFHPPSA